MTNTKIYKQLLYQMMRIRKVEQEIANKYIDQNMRCPVHLSVGQEAVAVGICSNLNTSDHLLSAHRSHYHYLAKGGNLTSMIGELHGKKSGCAQGKGGSMHLIDLKAGVIAAVPIVGSTIPIGVGVAWGNKLKKQNKVVTIFFGDGATEEGVFYESINFAALHNLPVLFICENNFYSVYSSLSSRQAKNRNILKTVEGMGVKSYSIDGNKVDKIHQKSKNIISQIRKNNKPVFIELKTYRFLEHCGPFNDDNLNYRSTKEIKLWKSKCPIEYFKNKMIDNSRVNAKEMIDWENKIEKEIALSFTKTLKNNFPSKKDLMKDIYA
ncbi:thiamine pyrophosphate-dependent dehydrogenase E1 component subunit alpha [Alphaproteobacteria bacterium]|nr:thiamine pyrophosphate-dependent dehydrogenase E1 component subunit alpha [Alphaproteobacteria bacterium]